MSARDTLTAFGRRLDYLIGLGKHEELALHRRLYDEVTRENCSYHNGVVYGDGALICGQQKSSEQMIIWFSSVILMSVSLSPLSSGISLWTGGNNEVMEIYRTVCQCECGSNAKTSAERD